LIDADLLLRNFHLITMQDNGQPYGLIENGAVAIRGGEIVWVGSSASADVEAFSGNTVEGNGRYLGPGLIDCHTHLVWGGSRADEWEMRLQGISYEEIARRGETETERKMLTVATELRNSTPLDIQRTFLGAHAVPPEFKGKPEQYIDLVCGEMLQSVAGLCESIDVFCEGIGFDLSQSRRVLEAGKQAGLEVRIHAEQLSNLGGTQMAAELGALSADHIEYLDEAGVQAMADQGTVAVLLPGAFYFIHETQLPPVDLLRKHNVPIAIATDANPGSSPATNLLLMANMACTLFRMTPEEALAGVTSHAAKALGMQDRVGTIDVGKQADLVAWNIQSPAELAYGIGHNPCEQVWKRGELIVDQNG